MCMESQKNEKKLSQIPQETGYYLAGFADGEGSFNVSLRKRSDHTLGWQVVPTFNVSQKDKTVLMLFKRYLGCGKLRQRKDGVWQYIVQNPVALDENVIPFFRKFPFLSKTKIRNFSIFRKIIFLIMRNAHLTPKGLQEIVNLRETLNIGHGRKRKYELDDYTQSLTENPQRLHAEARSRNKRKENRA